jgi:5'-nucleotidase/UDP-sugar diphosphatase
MKYIKELLGVLFLGTFLLTSGPVYADYSLNILHFNDMHARFEPINKYDSGCKPKDDLAGKCFGGAARMKTALDNRRAALGKAKANVLTLVGGDMFQGSLFYVTYKGSMSADVLNQFGVDAFALGNHEFDNGPKVLENFANKVKFPLLFANADLNNEPRLKDKISPYVVKEVGGQKIGIIGLTTPDTAEIANPGPTVKFTEEEKALPGIIAKLKEQGVNKIILLTHIGFRRDVELAGTIEGVDVIVGGHSNTLPEKYPTMVKGPGGKSVAVVQAYAYGKYLGEVSVAFDDDGNVKKAKGQPWLMNAMVEPDPEMLAYVKQAAAPLEKLKATVIGKTSAAIDGNRKSCRADVCEMGVLVADAMLASVKDQGINLAIQNGGGLRASIDAGDITMGEVLTVLPFQNALATFKLNGAGVIAALENGFSRGRGEAGRFPQVAGMKVTWNPAADSGSRVVSAMVQGADGTYKPVDKSAVYGVVTNNYMRGGGDGYKIFATDGMEAYDFGDNLEDVVSAYLKAKGTYKPYVDQRLTAVK